MLVAALSDSGILVMYLIAGFWANSLTILAEWLRGTLLLILEVVLLFLLRRIHRGRIEAYDYGSGKIEQFANLSIGVVMGLAGLWVGGTAAYRWWYPPEQASAGLVFCAVAGALNVVVNGAAFWVLWRAGRDGTSVIMLGQIRTRLTKLISSAVVLLALMVNALFGDSRIGIAAEVLGSAFVSLVMLELAVSMWRNSLPSLLDATLAEAQQERINRALARHFDAYDDLVAVRSRLSGRTPIIEITLGFAGRREMAEVQQVVGRLSAEVEALIPGARVLVIPVACPS